MVGVAQSVERLTVDQEVAGSSPVVHPSCINKSSVFRRSSVVERAAVKQAALTGNSQVKTG
jgi:hypothetical protein